MLKFKICKLVKHCRKSGKLEQYNEAFSTDEREISDSFGNKNRGGIKSQKWLKRGE